MTYTTYVDGDGLKKNRRVRNAGTQADPYESYVFDEDLNLVTGARTDAAATTTSATASIVSLFKGFWTAFGLISQAADSTGSLMQRVRAVVDRLGSFGDAASSTGSVMAQLRNISDSLNRTTSVAPINITAAGEATVIAATAGKSIMITSLYFTVDSAVNITFKAGTVALSGAMPVFEHGSDYSQPLPVTSGQPFILSLPTAATVRGYVVWYLV